MAIKKDSHWVQGGSRGFRTQGPIRVLSDIATTCLGLECREGLVLKPSAEILGEWTTAGLPKTLNTKLVAWSEQVPALPKPQTPNRNTQNPKPRSPEPAPAAQKNRSSRSSRFQCSSSRSRWTLMTHLAALGFRTGLLGTFYNSCARGYKGILFVVIPAPIWDRKGLGVKRFWGLGASGFIMVKWLLVVSCLYGVIGL